MIALTNHRKTAKTAIIDHLSKEFPLTTKKIHHTLQREYGMDVSYQAVHKAIQELEKEKIVSKTNEGWQLDGEWLQNQEKFIQGTKQKYSGKKNRYDINLNNPNPQVFEFDNMTDFSVETAKLVADKILCQKKESSFLVMEYGYWSFKFKFEHLMLLHRYVQSKGKSSFHIVRRVTPFGKWAQKQYERVGGVGIIGSDIDVEDDFLVQGDWVVQVHFPSKSKEIIKKYYNKWQNLEDCYREFGLKEEPKMMIYATVTRNKTMANLMKDKFTTIIEWSKITLLERKSQNMSALK